MAWVQSLVGGLRSHKPHCQNKQTKTRSEKCRALPVGWALVNIQGGSFHKLDSSTLWPQWQVPSPFKFGSIVRNTAGMQTELENATGKKPAAANGEPEREPFVVKREIPGTQPARGRWWDEPGATEYLCHWPQGLQASPSHYGDCPGAPRQRQRRGPFPKSKWNLHFLTQKAKAKFIIFLSFSLKHRPEDRYWTEEVN